MDAWRAVESTATGCANRGLDVDKDLAGIEHYAGPVGVDDNGDFVVEGFGDAWNGVYSPGDGYLFGDAVPWVDAMSEPMSINVWVEQE